MSMIYFTNNGTLFSLCAQLALRRWPNVSPTSTLTLGQRQLTDVKPTWICQLAQRWPNGCAPTLGQHRPNVGTLTLGQRWHNVAPMVVCQRCTNIGPTEAALLAFCQGNPSVTDGFPSQRARNAGVDVCLNNRLNKQSSWVTGDLRHQCDRLQCNIHKSKDVTVLFRRCTDCSKHNVLKDNGLSLAGAKPLSEPTLVYIVNWTLANKLQWKFNRNSYICFQENAFSNVCKNDLHFVWAQWVDMNQVFMLVYSTGRSVTMPGLDQNWSLLPALERFQRQVVLANYQVKTKYKGSCAGPTLGRYRPCDVGPTSLRRWVDVARRCRPNIGSMSVTILVYYNQNKQKCSTTKRHDSFLSSKKSNNNNGSLHDACKPLKQM